MEQHTGVSVKGHIKIFDPNTGEVFADKDNAINFEAMSVALANSLGNKGYGFVKKMAFGNGGSSIDATGLITYLPPNVTGTNEALYNQTYSKDINSTLVTHPSGVGALYSDLMISCTIPPGGPDAPSGQAAFDNDPSLTNAYTFDELGLQVPTDATGTTLMLISHVVFHPVQKSLNREIQIDYTIRIQALTNLMSI